MQTPEMTMRIEMFGNLVEELAYWGKCCDDQEEDRDELEYCEQMFSDTLEAVREFREILLEDLEIYRSDCKRHQIPEDISYYRIYKQLQESSFSV
jgi:hypothetical protein